MNGGTARAGPSPANLFKPARRGDRAVPGWNLKWVKRRYGGAIDALLVPVGGGSSLTIRLTRRDPNRGAFCRTRSFNVVYLTPHGEGSPTPARIHRVMNSICRLVHRNDRGQITLGRYTPSAMPGYGRAHWQWIGFPDILFLLGFGILAFLFFFLPSLARPRARMAAWIERNPWPLMGVLIAAMAVPRLMHLDLPFDTDYMTQRLFFGSLDPGDILAHRYQDQRHPQLFYLILHVFQWFGHSERIVRLPAVIFSLAAAATFFVLLRPYLGTIRSLAAVAMLGLSESFLAHSRDITDLTLFMFLSLLSLHLFLRCLDRPRRNTLIAFAAAQTAMFYSYYLALLVCLAQAAVLLIQRRWSRNKWIWLAFGAAFIMALPALVDLSTLIAADIQARQVAHQFPAHYWGEKTVGQYLERLSGLMVPAGSPGLLAGVLLLLGAGAWLKRDWKRPPIQVLVILLLVSAVVMTAAVLKTRMMEYYLLFLLPPVLALTTVGALGFPETEPREDTSSATAMAWHMALRRAVQWIAVGIVLGGYAHDLYWTTPRLMSASGRDHYARLGGAIKRSGGADVVVADPDSLHSILLYYAFPSPTAMYRTCRWPERKPVVCRHGGRALHTLTAMNRMSRGWESRSLARLRALSVRQLWFVHFERFKNDLLLSHVKARCARKGRWGPLTLYRCPPLSGQK